MRVLLAEDDPIARHILDSLLTRWGYDVVAVDNGAHALDLLKGEDPPPLAILDWMMPKMDGIEVCRRVRQRTGEPYIYIFLLTAKDAKSDMVEGMEAGADDYLTKPFHQGELRVRLRAAARVLDLQSALIAAREQLRDQATHDGLTGLWNRTSILAELERELSRGERQRTPTTVIMADLDHFKRVNDTYGHMAGDEILRATAAALRACVRKYDSVGRYGGEEFIILAPGCDTSGAAELTESIRRTIASSPVEIGEKALSVTLSLGAATTEGGRSGVLEAIHAADMALYQAKDGGRDRAVCVLADAALPGSEGAHAHKKGTGRA